LIYCADLSLFNTSYSEKEIECFETITSSQWVKDISVSLLLNNINEMEEKFKYYKSTHKITYRLFPEFIDYCDGHVGEFEKFVSYQKERYIMKYRGNQNLYIMESSEDLCHRVYNILVDIAANKSFEKAGLND